MSKSRQNSNTPNRLSVADRTELLTKTGTREGEVILQRDIGLLYAWTDTQGTDNGGTVLNVGAGSWLAQYSGAVNVKWFGAVGDGVTDDTVAIQSAIDSVDSGKVYLPSGVYRIISSINISKHNINIIGDGRATVISQDVTTGNTINVSNVDDGEVYGFSISALNIKPLVSSITSGSAIHMDGARNFNITDVILDDAFVGLTLLGCTQGVINDLLCLYESDNGGLITGRKYVSIAESTNVNVGNKHCGDVFFNNFNGRCGNLNYCETGVEILSGDGIWFNNFHIGNCVSNNLHINASSTIKCTGMMFQHGWFDLGGAIAIKISGSTPSVIGKYYFRNNKLLGGNTGSYGADIDGSATEVVFSNNAITNYFFSGINIRSGFTGSGEITDNIIRDCAQSSIGGGNGIGFASDTIWKIEGNTIRGSRHAWHILISGSKTESYINRNTLSNIVDAGTMNELIGTRISQMDNFNFNPIGGVSEAVGASPYTYTNAHGFPVQMQIYGGVISQLVWGGSTLGGGKNEGTFTLGIGDTMTITYSSTPYIYIQGL